MNSEARQDCEKAPAVSEEGMVRRGEREGTDLHLVLGFSSSQKFRIFQPESQKFKNFKQLQVEKECFPLEMSYIFTNIP